MRQVPFDRPFIDGVVTDQPAYKLGPRNSRSAKDLVAPRGIATARRGWTYEDSVQVVAADLASVHRNKYVLAGQTRTVVVDSDNGQLVIANYGSAGTAVADLYDNMALPRCVYNDQLVLCGTNGIYPAQFYSGAAVAASGATIATATWTANQATITATSGTFGASLVKGAYMPVGIAGTNNFGPLSYARILERVSSTVLTIEGVKAASTVTLNVDTGYSTGWSFPCVPIYDAGTGSFDNANDEFDGTGTVWQNPDVLASYADALLAKRSADVNEVHYISNVDSTVILQLFQHNRTETNINYEILRACPFRDAASHKGSLFGSGVYRFPMRIWVAPPGWMPHMPPGFTPPYDPTTIPSSDNVNDFKLDYIDVPAAYDGDAVVAITHSGDPLIVCKRKDAWGLYGSYPVFERSILPNGAGAGCIDIRSCHTLSPGPVWAGEDDIFVFNGTQVEGMTQGKINREWRAITGDFDFGTDFCTVGESQGHLFVSISSNGGSAHVAKVMDLETGAWVSNQFTNHKARYFFTSKVEDEEERFIWVGDDEQGRIMNSSAVIEGGLAKDGDSTSPSFDAYTGEALDGSEEIDQEHRVLDVAISANVYDVGAAGSTAVEVSMISAGSLYAPTEVTTTLGTINSDTVDRPDRSFFDPVDVDGRTHQLRVRSTAIGTNSAATKIEIPELVMTVRDVRTRT